MIEKIQLLSDLHLDTQRRHFEDVLFEVINPKADLYIMAGDIVEYDEATKFVKAMKVVEPYKPVLWIMGNHEYHHGRAPDVIANNCKRVAEMGERNLFVAENEDFIFNEGEELEFKVICATLWTNLRANPLSEYAVTEYMSDFRRIKGFDGDFWQTKHNHSLTYIKNMLQEDRTTPTIVATHHSPSLLAVPDMYKGQINNYGYASDLEYCFYESWSPNMWLHGHTHDPYDKMHGNTRVIRNPYGYKSFGEEVSFDKNFLIDVYDVVYPFES